MDLILDVNTQIYPMDLGEFRYFSLSIDEEKNDGNFLLPWVHIDLIW